jgi:hypothetical protein
MRLPLMARYYALFSSTVNLNLNLLRRLIIEISSHRMNCDFMSVNFVLLFEFPCVGA